MSRRGRPGAAAPQDRDPEETPITIEIVALAAGLQLTCLLLSTLREAS